MILAGVLLAFAGIFLAARALHVLDTAKASAWGADSMPIVFAPPELLFFFALFLCACYVFQRIWEKRASDSTFVLILYSILMVAAALGRCQGDHVFWDGAGIFLASMFYVSSRKIAWRRYKIAFLVKWPMAAK